MDRHVAAFLSLAPAIVLIFTMVIYFVTSGRRTPEGQARARAGRRLLTARLIDYWYWLHAPAERLALKLKLTPDALTSLGLGVTVAAGLAFGAGYFGLAGWLVLAGGSLDILDGAIARRLGLTSPAGAFWDSTADRIGDWALYAGLAFAYRESWALALVLVALGAGQLTSYVRAKAEAVGARCSEGLVQRAERMMGLAAMGIATPMLAGFGNVPYEAPMLITLGVLAVLSSVTAGARVVNVRRSLAPVVR